MPATHTANARALVAGMLLACTTALIGTRIRFTGLGIAWSVSLVLLGFVACAACMTRDGPLQAPRLQMRAAITAMAAKALSAWLLGLGVAHLPLLSFCVAFIVAAVFSTASLVSGIRLRSLLLVAGAVVTLALSGDNSTDGGTLVKNLVGVMSIVGGGSLAIGIGLANPQGWSGFDGFVAVVVLAVIGVLENLTSVNRVQPTTDALSPIILFIAGAFLYVAAIIANRHVSVGYSPTGMMLISVLLQALGFVVLPRPPGGVLFLSLSAMCAASLACITPKQPNFTDVDSATLIMKPSLLFAGGAAQIDHENLFRSVFRNQRERKLAAFLLLTVAIMILEFIYGVSVNSLGLISDSFHMMLDGASIAIGLYAAHAASWPADEKTHPFGYGRYEVLGGFVNGVLLLFIAFYVMLESAERLIDPPEITASYLLLVSIVGLVVNIVGVIFFHDSHGHSHSHGHDHDHGDSGSCGKQRVDHNMRGVYLHILADLLGSVSVILSSLFIYFFNFWIADPLCSALSATLILLSAFPLLEETGKILLLTGPPHNSNFSETLRKQLLESGQLAEVDVPKLWMHSTAPRELMVCLISAKMSQDGVYIAVRSAVMTLVEKTIHDQLGLDDVNIILNLE